MLKQVQHDDLFCNFLLNFNMLNNIRQRRDAACGAVRQRPARPGKARQGPATRKNCPAA
jgi:hypothetical protein